MHNIHINEVSTGQCQSQKRSQVSTFMTSSKLRETTQVDQNKLEYSHNNVNMTLMIDETDSWLHTC